MVSRSVLNQSIHVRFTWRPPGTASPEAQFGVSDEELTGLAGLALVARLVKYLGLAEGLARLVRVKRRRRGCRDEQMLLSLIYSFCAGRRAS